MFVSKYKGNLKKIQSNHPKQIWKFYSLTNNNQFQRLIKKFETFYSKDCGSFAEMKKNLSYRTLNQAQVLSNKASK